MAKALNPRARRAFGIVLSWILIFCKCVARLTIAKKESWRVLENLQIRCECLSQSVNLSIQVAPSLLFLVRITVKERLVSQKPKVATVDLCFVDVPQFQFG